MSEIKDPVVITEEVKNPENGGSNEPKLKTYTDEQVNEIVISKKKEIKAKMEKELEQRIAEQTKIAVEEATKPLIDSNKELTERLAAKDKAEQEAREKAIIEANNKKKLDAVTKTLTENNAINAQVLLPHVNLDKLVIDESGNVDASQMVEGLKAQFPTMFGKVVPRGDNPAGGQNPGPKTVEDYAKEGNNVAALNKLFLK